MMKLRPFFLANATVFILTATGTLLANPDYETMLPRGARLVAGDPAKNEFYILAENDKAESVEIPMEHRAAPVLHTAQANVPVAKPIAPMMNSAQTPRVVPAIAAPTPAMKHVEVKSVVALNHKLMQLHEPAAKTPATIKPIVATTRTPRAVPVKSSLKPIEAMNAATTLKIGRHVAKRAPAKMAAPGKVAMVRPAPNKTLHKPMNVAMAKVTHAKPSMAMTHTTVKKSVAMKPLMHAQLKQAAPKKVVAFKHPTSLKKVAQLKHPAKHVVAMNHAKKDKVVVRPVIDIRKLAHQTPKAAHPLKTHTVATKSVAAPKHSVNRIASKKQKPAVLGSLKHPIRPEHITTLLHAENRKAMHLAMNRNKGIKRS